ncbi:MAG TPA: hypothetical protein VKR38_17255 [Usitatibacter sp.]|nr:hypothetical protein [Usitatibacter sp.]
MNTNLRKNLLKAAVAVAVAAPLFANADSAFTTSGASPYTAAAHLDFAITIPKFLFLQVGAGTSMAANATINQIAFTVPAANVGDASLISASATSGDLGNGVVTARVIGNNGAITFSSLTVGALSNGSGDSISYAQIKTTVNTNTSTTALSHPTLTDGGPGTSVALTPNVGTKVTNLDAKWTYQYLNQNVVPPGTYGGVNAQNSRVTYTASMP